MNTNHRSCPLHILNFIQSKTCSKIRSVQEFPSAQQQVWIVELVDEYYDNLDDELWKDCLHMGNSSLVIRQWKGGCQWWNLNTNSSSSSLAEMEIQGYISSRRAISAASSSLQQQQSIVIPRVLHYQLPPEQSDHEDLPWAILEYVGLHSNYFPTCQTKWMEEMVKSRHEFGFEEPHPRWGRVPASKALEYATMVLEQVVIPLHVGSLHDAQKHANDLPVRTYESMIEVYQNVYQDILKQLVAMHYHSPPDNAKQYQLWNQIMEVLDTAVHQVLPANASHIPKLEAVLVHLDLQPQNLLFSQHQHIAVLDWEDASWADPRFELVLLGRKICSDLGQAQSIWKRYEQLLQQNLGPLQPWLQLETTHSLLTLLLQSLSSQGRNPWETGEDLEGKLTRECARWHTMMTGQENDHDWTTPTIESSLNTKKKDDSGTSKTTTTIASQKQPIAADDDEDYLETLGIHPAKCYRPE